jgi:iron complex transport system ATP-binding protein
MIARALAQDTRFIVLDEPTAYLDLPNKYELIALLRDIVESEGKTVIYTTHDLHIAIGESDKIWLLGTNNLYEGSPEDLMREGRFANLFTESKLEFADESGLYIYPSRTIGKIAVDASPGLEKLTLRAILRLKIETGSGHELPLLKARGDYNKPEWFIVIDGKEICRFNNIYTLSNYLKRDLFSDSAYGNR